MIVSHMPVLIVVHFNKHIVAQLATPLSFEPRHAGDHQHANTRQFCEPVRPSAHRSHERLHPGLLLGLHGGMMV